MPHPRIHSDPAILMGKPCIAGTRIAVSYILERLEDGDVIAAAHARLTVEDVRAAIAYARDVIADLPQMPAAQAQTGPVTPTRQT